MSIDSLIAAPFPSSENLSPDEIEARVSETLQALVQANGFAKSDAVLAAGRASIELRSLILPKAEDAELPDMVRFQAQRTFAQLTDNSPLDFIKLPVESSESTHVLAASMNGIAFAKAKRMAEQSGLTPKRIMLRPMASVAMAMAAVPALLNESVLIVNVIGDEADLLVAQSGTVVLIRTARLPSGDEAIRRKSLASEIKRTRIASESQTPAVRPTRLAIWGNLGGENIANDFEEQTGLPTTALDLRTAVDLKAKQLPEGNLDRFAAVAGLLLQATHNDHKAIDFMEPRRRPDPKSPVRMIALIGSAVAAVVLLLGYLYISNTRALDSEIARLTKESNGMNKQVETAKLKVDQLTKVENFLRSDFQWLDELAQLSEKSPDAESMMILGQLSVGLEPNSPRGAINGNVVAMDNETIRKLKESSKNARHTFDVSKTAELNNPNLPYQYTSSLRIAIEPPSTKEIKEFLAKPSLPKPAEEEEVEAEEEKKDSKGDSKRGEFRGGRRSRGAPTMSPSAIPSKRTDQPNMPETKKEETKPSQGESDKSVSPSEVKPPSEVPATKTEDKPDGESANKKDPAN